MEGVVKSLYTQGKSSTCLVRDGGVGYFLKIPPHLVDEIKKNLGEIVELDICHDTIVSMAEKAYTPEGYVPTVKVEKLRDFRD